MRPRFTVRDESWQPVLFRVWLGIVLIVVLSKVLEVVCVG